MSRRIGGSPFLYHFEKFGGALDFSISVADLVRDGFGDQVAFAMIRKLLILDFFDPAW